MSGCAFALSVLAAEVLCGGYFVGAAVVRNKQELNHDYRQANQAIASSADQAAHTVNAGTGIAQLAGKISSDTITAAEARSLIGTEQASELDEPRIILGEIIGYRCWRVVPDGTLFSISFDDVWPTDAPMKGTPEPHGTAGVHAFKRETDAREYVEYQPADHLVGTVALWGTVIEHEDGYRAEFARPTSLNHPTSWHRFLGALGIGNERLKLARRSYGISA